MPAGDSIQVGTDIAIPSGKQGLRIGWGGMYEDGERWDARALRISRPTGPSVVEQCRIRIETKGYAMTYLGSLNESWGAHGLSGYADEDAGLNPPDFEKVLWVAGRNCQYGLIGGSRVRFVYPSLPNANTAADAYVPRIRVRGMTLATRAQPYCPVRVNDGIQDSGGPGECLPVAKAPPPSGIDRDQDCMDDSLEAWAAETFAPRYIHDSAFGDVSDREAYVEPPVQMYQAYWEDKDTIHVEAGLLWRSDDGWGPDSYDEYGDSHTGDYSDLRYTLKRLEGTDYWHLGSLHLWTEADWQNNLPIDTDHPGLSFHPWEPYVFPQRTYSTRPWVFLSGYHHHPYVDTYFDHQDSAYSHSAWIRPDEDVNGRGHHLTASAYINVGDSGHHLVSTMGQVRSDFYDYDFWLSVPIVYNGLTGVACHEFCGPVSDDGNGGNTCIATKNLTTHPTEPEGCPQ